MATDGDFTLLRADYADLLRAHTRAIWALKGEAQYPEDERKHMGEHASKVLQWANGVNPREEVPADA